MGTPVTALQRSRANINTKRQQFYVTPQGDNINRDEIDTLWPRADSAITFLRDLNTFSQTQTELTNNEASASMDPKRTAFGQFAAFTGTAPLYAKPQGIATLPVEDPFLKIFWSNSVDTTTLAASQSTTGGVITTVTDQTHFIVPVRGIYDVGQAFYITGHDNSVRHIASIIAGTGTVGTLVLNSPFEFTVAATDTIEVGAVTYSFDDTQNIGLGSLLAQMDTMADLVSQMYVSKHTLDAANDQFLQHSFDIGGLKVFSGQQANFRALNASTTSPIDYVNVGTVVATDSSIYSDMTTLLSGGTMSAGATLSIVGSTTVNLTTSTTKAIPAGLIVEIDDVAGNITHQYVTAASAIGSVLTLAEGLVLVPGSGAAIRIIGVGNYRYENTGVIRLVGTTAAIGDTSIVVDGVAGASITNLPVPAGIPFELDGEVYTTAGATHNTTVSTTIQLSTPLRTAPADNTPINFATQCVLGVNDVSNIGPGIAFINSESTEVLASATAQVNQASAEKFWAPANALKVELSDGSMSYAGWDRVSAVQTITGCWRGMEGSAIQAITDWDNLDMYFPFQTAVATNPIQARKDVVTLIGDETIVTKAVRFAVDRVTVADDTERSLDDYSGLPFDDVRTYTLEVDANYHPSFFTMKWDAIMNTGRQIQTTIGPVKGKRISIYIPKATFSDPTKDAGSIKMGTTITAKPFIVGDAGEQAVYLSYC